MAISDPHIYEFGDFRLDSRAVALYERGRHVAIKPKAFDLLSVLIKEPGRVFKKGELMERLWPDTFVEEANLTQTIYELRRALGESARKPRFIENVPRRGYRFRGAPTLGPAEEDVTANEIRSLAVLPFRPLVEAARDESLELGIAETLATGISALGRMIVRPTSAVRRFIGPGQDPLAAARTLEVDAVLHGTIQHSSGNRLRVAARLDKTEGGPPLWAGQFDEQSDDLFALQDSLLEKMLAALSVKLTPVERSRRAREASVNPEVHRLFLKCRYHWHKWTPENWRLSIEFGERAIELDPAHAQAYAWVAASYATLGIFGEMRPAEAFGIASRLAARSLELDGGSSKAHEMHAAIKLFYEWDWAALPDILKRSADLDPSNSTAFNLWALFDAIQGRFDNAIERIDRAVAIDPLSLVSNTDRGFVLMLAGRFDAAAEQFARALELDPFFSHAHYGMGFVHIAMGRNEAGLANMLNGAGYEGTMIDIAAEVGYARGRCGDTASALRTIELQKEKARDGYYDPYRIALVYSGLEDRENTLAYLDRAFANRSRELAYLARQPAFAWLRGDKKFEQLVARILQ